MSSLPGEARVVVIGAGIVANSLACHLARLGWTGLEQGRLTPAASEQTITYHDSCYPARHNDVLAPPRDLAAAVGRPIEERVRQAGATAAEILAVACPFCTVMLDDGAKSTGDDMRVVDVATLLAEAAEPRSGANPER